VDQGKVIPNSTRAPIESTSSLDQLSENLREVEKGRVGTGDISQQIQDNLKNIIYGVVAVVFLSLGIRWMLEGRERAKGASSQRFEAAQRDFQELFLSSSTLTPESKENLTRAFEGKLRAITDVDARSTYGQFADFYKIAANYRAGQLDLAIEALAPYKIDQLKGTGELSPEEFKLEVALLMKGKILSTATNTKEQGKVILKELTERGRVLSGEALLSYTRIFGVEQSLVDKALELHPHLRDKLAEELSDLGAKI